MLHNYSIIIIIITNTVCLQTRGNQMMNDAEKELNNLGALLFCIYLQRLKVHVPDVRVFFLKKVAFNVSRTGCRETL